MEERRLRVVLVGCGAIARTWLAAARTIGGVDVVGLVDLRLEAAHRCAEEFELGPVEIDADLAVVLARTHPDIVFNCTVPEAHTDVALEAFRHGCHVLSEKPLASNLRDAKRLVHAARDNGRLFAVTQNRRYDARLRRLRCFVESGAIGPLTTVHSDFFIGAHFGGFREQMPHVLLVDMAIHTFDAARYLTGADPVAVYCHEWNPRGSWYDRDASAVAIFEMTGGLVYTYRGSWCSEGFNTTWEAEWRLIGERGSALWDGGERMAAQVVAAVEEHWTEMRGVEIPQPPAHLRVGGHQGAIREFLDCVRSGGTPETTGEDNVKSLAMVFAAVESAETGRRVTVRFD